MLFEDFFLLTAWLCNFLAKDYQHKSSSKNVGETDSWAVMNLNGQL